MSRATRTKGLGGELEVRRIWEAAGLPVRALEGEGDHLIVCGNGLNLHSEVKRQERVQLPMWLRQAAREAPPGSVPVVAFRQNRGAWVAALPLEDLARIVGALEAALRAAAGPAREEAGR